MIRRSFFQVIYYQLTRKIMLTYLIHNNPDGYWRYTLACSICGRLEIYRLLWNVWFLLSVNISSRFFTIIDYLRFPSQYHLVFSAITTFSEGLPSSMKPWFKKKQQQVNICKRSLLDFISYSYVCFFSSFENIVKKVNQIRWLVN